MERARLFKRRPMRAGQIPLSQPVVTSHNSFSGLLRNHAEFTNRGIPTAQPTFLCPEVWFRRMMESKMCFLPSQHIDTSEDNLISASLIIA
jgi:hypothetical protein